MLHITNEHPTVLETTTIHLLSELLIARRIIEILISTPVKAILSYHETRYVTWKKKNKQTNRKIRIQLLQKIVRAFIRH